MGKKGENHDNKDKSDCPDGSSLPPGCNDRQTDVCLEPHTPHQKDDDGCPSNEGAWRKLAPCCQNQRTLESFLEVNQYNPSKGSKEGHQPDESP